jgi:hypothetical protein
MAGSILHPDSWEFELMGRLGKYEDAIDANFGDFYTAEHPELVAACIQHAALADLAEAVRDAAGTIDPCLRVIAENLPR